MACSRPGAVARPGVKGEPPGICLIYPQGNFVRASDDTPYLQIGENKYGKPMLDRLVSPALTLE